MPGLHSLMLSLAAGLPLNLPVAHLALRLAGAAYLVYLGVRALRASPHVGPAAALEPAPLGAVFRPGVVQRLTGGVFIALGARLASGARP